MTARTSLTGWQAFSALDLVLVAVVIAVLAVSLTNLFVEVTEWSRFVALAGAGAVAVTLYGLIRSPYTVHVVDVLTPVLHDRHAVSYGAGGFVTVAGAWP